MSDRLAIMHHGSLLQVGTPEEVYTAPASAFVANFIGVSNGLSGRVEEIEGDRASLAVEGIGLVRAPVQAELRKGASVLMTIRPERVELSRDPGMDGDQNQVVVRIAKVIYSGNETHYLVTLPNNLVWKARIANTDGQTKRFEVGESAFLKWRAAQSVVLLE